MVLEQVKDALTPVTRSPWAALWRWHLQEKGCWRLVAFLYYGINVMR
jgi:hypothetical protein